MLTAGERFTLPGLDGIAVFPDDSLVGGFYAVSTVPRVVVDVDGRPAISLTVYGRRTAGAFDASGGILAVTTELAVLADDQARLRAALAARLAEGWGDRHSDPPQPQLLAPEWVEAAATVQLTAELLVTGQPSMSSTNQCSFSSKLTDAGASALARAWREGLAGAVVSYTGRVRSGGAGLGMSRSRLSRTSYSSTATSSSVHTSSSSSSSSWSSSGSGGAETSRLRRSDEEQPGVEQPTVAHFSSSTSWESGAAVDAGDAGSVTNPGPAGVPTTDGDLIIGSARLADSVPDLRAHLLFVEL